MDETAPRAPLPGVIVNQEAAPPGVPSVKPQLSEPSPSQEPPVPMLDVHAPHETVRGWRDFFTHIAIIAIGLCIATGIEQTVEFIHHRRQLAEFRQALRLEREENHRLFTELSISWRWETAELQNNLLVFQYLQQHPGTPQEKLPGILLWKRTGNPVSSAVWDAAHQTGVIALMPREEIEANALLYQILQLEFDADMDLAHAMIEAQRYSLSDSDPSHLSPLQIATEIELTEVALSKHFILGSLLANVRENCPDFPPTVTREELHRLTHEPDLKTTELLSPARALTEERLKAAGYVDPSLQPAP